jgi:hypothetical protein
MTFDGRSRHSLNLDFRHANQGVTALPPKTACCRSNGALQTPIYREPAGRKYRRFGSCKLDATSWMSPRLTSANRRVRAARGVRPIRVAISAVVSPESRHAITHVLDGQTKWQQAGVFYFQSIIEERSPNRRAALGIICMHHGVDDRLPYCCGRQRPSVRVTHTADLYAMQIVLPHEAYCLVNRARQWTADLQSVDQMPMVGTRRP